jgi:sulfite reductase alpha subunit-like flavoprotein
MPPAPPVASVRVLYATATGTAEDVARDVAQRFTLCGLSVAGCTTVDSYSFATMPVDASRGTIFVYVIATAGDGEAPASMLRFWTALRSAGLPRNALAGVRFAVFGLGDRSYTKFNAAARRLATRMSELGAFTITPLALGDESAPGGYDAAFRPWIEALFSTTVLGYANMALPSPLPPPKPRWNIDLQKLEVPRETTWGGDFKPVADAGKWRTGQVPLKRRLPGATEAVVVESHVSVNRVLTNPDVLRDDREVRHIELDVPMALVPEFLTYVPGDVVNVMPRNRASAVDAFLQLTGLDGQDIITLTASASNLHGEHVNTTRKDGLPDADLLNIQTPCALADFVAAQLDLSAMPRRRFLEHLAPYASDDMQRDKLVEFASKENAESLTQYAYREKRTILIALRDFPSARPPLAQLIDMIPPLRPRAFSIASSRAAHKNKIHICAAMVRYTTPLRFARIGVCSSFWLNCEVGDIVPVFLEKGTLRFDETRPAILVGPGTGVAPMRSFISSLPAAFPSDTDRVLYFGCRQSRGDYLYANEWADALLDKRMSRLESAFSRENAFGRKVYVQDLMKRDAAELWRLIVDGGAIYVAGSAGDMPKGVRFSIATAAVNAGGMSERDAERFVRQLEATRRLQVECW